MSFDSTFNIAMSNSGNLTQTFNNKNFNPLLNQTSITKKQKKYFTEASNFLKTQLSSMIKNELRAYRLQKKLDKQLEEFKKNKQKKQFIQQTHNIQKFRQNQSEALKSKFEQFLKNKQRRDSIVEEVIQRRKFQNEIRRRENKNKIQNVRKRYIESQEEDTQLRLSRAESMNQSHSLRKSTVSKNSNDRHISSSINHRDLIHSRLVDEQKYKITTYLRKMKHAQNRILQKQLKNEQKKEKSLKSQVKNLTKQRNYKQEQKMKTFEDKFQTKMGSFYESLNRSKLQNSMLLMNRSMIKSKLREKVIKNKQVNDSKMINKTLSSFMIKTHNKQNYKNNNEKKMDLLRTKSSFMNTAIKIQKQDLQKQSQRNVRILYQKLNRIKKLSANESINEKEREGLLSLINNQDPLYFEIAEFLSNPKSEFLRKKIEKQQQMAKSDKMKKTTRFNNKN